MDIKIYCNYCDTQTKLVREYIHMQCMCDEERRMLSFKEYILYGKHQDYLYSMLKEDFHYVEKCD